MEERQEPTPKSPRGDRRLSSVEADAAYFEALLELVGEPKTTYQRAQLKAYRLLEESLQQTLARLRGGRE